ncbi:hypothetical protein CFC21_023558 [Triticum aestivum]|uniref:Dipeptidylpeptidase IV N-terminal domain-containing protein n=3 Tax=Triticum aestivum TaxID=4565 RepID=A0A9R1EF78_WHEAT|nr:uncharacterized protein LOC123066881 [Triticum aestivum]KAF7008909.1 hypothetical protein CFC21_023558 [Triticum aestivum]
MRDHKHKNKHKHKHTTHRREGEEQGAAPGTMAESRSTIAFFGTSRPPVALDLFSCPANPPPSSPRDEQRLTDGVSYNHNGRAIPAAALKELLAFLAEKKDPALALAGGATPEEVDKGGVTGLVFVSGRDNGLETLHVALRTTGDKTTVLSLADIYGADTFGGIRMEDSGCLAGGFEAGGLTVGHSLVYVSTKGPAAARRTPCPWTVVYKTNLADGTTERLTPPDQYDLNPAVSPSGQRVAVANFRSGEIGRLKTDIVVMNVDREAQGGLGRSILIKDGGWPTWGSDNVIFFHRGVDTKDPASTDWGVYRYDLTTKDTIKVTPDDIQAMTPAAIDKTTVAVAVTRETSMDRTRKEQHRHIEIFEVGKPASPVVITHGTTPLADHYSPFVLDGGSRVGFHRCRTDDDKVNTTADPKKKLSSPAATHKDGGLAGVFPSISNDGSKICYVDNEFRSVWVADEKGPRPVHSVRNKIRVLSTTWNQDMSKDTIYFCEGTADHLQICALEGASELRPNDRNMRRLTKGKFNDAFPSSNPAGTKFVFRSTRNRSGRPEDAKYNNLYIMEDAEEGEWGEGTVTQLTDGPWTDSHCSWSPRGDWIVFSSSRDRDILDSAGCFSIFLVLATDRKVLVRVMSLPGHVCHPIFSPDMDNLVVTSDVAVVSADPVSLPIFIASGRPYGDMFSIKLRDTTDINKNKDIMEFHRITHTRYEYSKPSWTIYFGDDPNDKWPTNSSVATPPCAPPLSMHWCLGEVLGALKVLATNLPNA